MRKEVRKEACLTTPQKRYRQGFHEEKGSREARPPRKETALGSTAARRKWKEKRRPLFLISEKMKKKMWPAKTAGDGEDFRS